MSRRVWEGHVGVLLCVFVLGRFGFWGFKLRILGFVVCGFGGVRFSGVLAGFRVWHLWLMLQGVSVWVLALGCRVHKVAHPVWP